MLETTKQRKLGWHNINRAAVPPCRHLSLSQHAHAHNSQRLPLPGWKGTPLPLFFPSLRPSFLLSLASLLFSSLFSFSFSFSFFFFFSPAPPSTTTTALPPPFAHPRPPSLHHGSPTSEHNLFDPYKLLHNGPLRSHDRLQRPTFTWRPPFHLYSSPAVLFFFILASNFAQDLHRLVHHLKPKQRLRRPFILFCCSRSSVSHNNLACGHCSLSEYLADSTSPPPKILKQLQSAEYDRLLALLRTFGLPGKKTIHKILHFFFDMAQKAHVLFVPLQRGSKLRLSHQAGLFRVYLADIWFMFVMISLLYVLIQITIYLLRLVD